KPDQHPRLQSVGGGAQGSGRQDNTTRTRSRTYASATLRRLAQAELLHLGLQALARDLELACGLGDVAARLVEGALDELALDALGLGAHGLLERARRQGGRRGRAARRLDRNGRESGQRHGGEVADLGREVRRADLRPLAEQ